MSSVNIEQWDELTEVFESFFISVDGKVECDQDMLCFNSSPHQVETSLSISRNGKFAAAMPLHGLDARIERIVFEQSEFEIRLLGHGVNYIYRVPPQLLILQGEEHETQ